MIIAGAGLVIIVGMLLRPVSTIDVEGSVKASRLQLKPQGRPIIPFDEPLQAFAASGFTGVDGIPMVGLPGDPVASLRAETLPGGTITLQQITVPRGSWFQIGSARYNQSSVETTASRSSSSGELLLSLDGPNRIMVRDDTVFTRRGSNLAVLIRFGPAPFNATITPADSIVELLRVIDADSLDFFDVQEFTDGSHEEVTSLSTIKSGVLAFPGLGDAQIRVGAREDFTLRSPTVRVHRIRLANGNVDVDFQARASAVMLGRGSDQRDLKPSMLEWYAANRRLGLARTVLFSGVVMLVAIIGWLRSGRS